MTGDEMRVDIATTSHLKSRETPKLQIAGIVHGDLANGPGARTTVFLQGCSHHCPGCQNPSTWDKNGGVSMTIEEVLSELDRGRDYHLSISGGEPMEQMDVLVVFLETASHTHVKDVWLWTGEKMEILTSPEYRFSAGREKLIELLRYVDFIVTGPFIKELYDPKLYARGSSNQRIYWNAQINRSRFVDVSDWFDEVKANGDTSKFKDIKGHLNEKYCTESDIKEECKTFWITNYNY